MKWLASAVLCLACSAHADTYYWIGRVPTAEIWRQQIISILNTAKDMQKAQATLNDTIMNAREAYFAKPTPANGEAFAKALMAKDMLYMTYSLQEGPDSKYTETMSKIAAVDGGIHPGAKRPFDDWIHAIRKSLGLGKREVLLFFNMEDVERAIVQNEGAYRAYRERRDRAESLRRLPPRNEFDKQEIACLDKIDAQSKNLGVGAMPLKEFLWVNYERCNCEARVKREGISPEGVCY